MTPPSPRLRVLITADAAGGVWVFAASLATALGADRFGILRGTLGPRPTSAQRDMLSSRHAYLLETDLKLEWQDPEGDDFSNAHNVLGAAADRFAPDLIHLNGFREALLPWSAPIVVVAHSCVNTWATSCGEAEHFDTEAWRTYTVAVRAALQTADAWVAPTGAMAEQMAGQYGLPGHGRVIWNGIDKNCPAPEPKLPFILGAGRIWDKAKNLASLARLAPELEWPVRIAGPAGAESAAISGPGCELLGELTHDALLREMQRASIFVSPAIYEPFGLSVMEAASAGCALVLANIASFRELWNGV